MVFKKASFFDTQAYETWAREDYTSAEICNLNSFVNDSVMPVDARILEPGCGTGRLTELMSRQVGPGGSVVALDMSRSMIDVCQSRLEVKDNVQLMNMTMEDANLKQKEYDAVVCHNVFHHFEEKLVMLGRISDTLKPCGQFIIHNFIPFDEINKRERKVSDLVYQDLMPSPEKLESMFSISGLRMVHCSDGEDGFLVKALKI